MKPVVKHLWSSVLAVGLVLGLVATALAQTYTATLTGTVSRAVIASRSRSALTPRP